MQIDGTGSRNHPTHLRSSKPNQAPPKNVNTPIINYRAHAHTLTASTTYFLVFTPDSGITGLRSTSSNSEDAGKASGWSIGDTSKWQRPAFNISWRDASGGVAGHSVEIAIRGAAVAATDTTAPTLSGTTPPTVNGNTLTLTYNEALDTGSVPAADAFGVKVGTNARALASMNPVAVAGSTVTLTLASAVTHGQTVEVSYTLPTAVANRLQDAAGNEAAALTGQTVTNNTSGGIVLSTIALGVLEGSSATYTVRLGAAPSGNVTVTVASDNADVTFDTNPVTAGDQSALTFTTANWGTAQTVTVSAAQDTDSTDDIADLSHTAAGGGYGTQSATLGVTVADDDRAAPALSTTIPPSVNSRTVTLTFDELLDETSTPAPSAFTVTAGGSAQTVSSVSISGATVRVLLLLPVAAGTQKNSTAGGDGGLHGAVERPDPGHLGQRRGDVHGPDSDQQHAGYRAIGIHADRG